MRTEPPLYGLDVETDTSVDGLDPRVGRIVAVAVAASDDDVRIFADLDEHRLLDRLDFHLASLEPGVIVTWNGAKFDLPYLADRARRLGVDLGLRLSLDPAIELHRPPLVGHHGAYRAAWHGHAHLDAYRLFRTDVVPALGISGSLKAVARACGLDALTVDTAQIHALSRSHLAAYVASDAKCTRELVARRWASARPAVDQLPATLPGRLAGATSPGLLRARAARTPNGCGPDRTQVGDDFQAPESEDLR